MNQLVQDQMAIFTLIQTGHAKQCFKMKRVVVQIPTDQKCAARRKHINRALAAWSIVQHFGRFTQGVLNRFGISRLGPWDLKHA